MDNKVYLRGATKGQKENPSLFSFSCVEKQNLSERRERKECRCMLNYCAKSGIPSILFFTPPLLSCFSSSLPSTPTLTLSALSAFLWLNFLVVKQHLWYRAVYLRLGWWRGEAEFLVCPVIKVEITCQTYCTYICWIPQNPTWWQMKLRIQAAGCTACLCFYIGYHSQQGEAFNTADPELVVCTLTGQGRHVNKEVLGLREGPGRRLAQCPAHMIVRVLSLVAGERERDREKEGQVDKLRKKQQESSSFLSKGNFRKLFSVAHNG